MSLHCRLIPSKHFSFSSLSLGKAIFTRFGFGSCKEKIIILISAQFYNILYLTKYYTKAKNDIANSVLHSKKCKRWKPKCTEDSSLPWSWKFSPSSTACKDKKSEQWIGNRRKLNGLSSSVFSEGKHGRHLSSFRKLNTDESD